jgi:hypothetical protein
MNGYTAIPEHVPLITSLILIWCTNDGLLPSHAYSFRDRPLDDQPTKEYDLPYKHITVVMEPELYRTVREAARLLCPD